MLRNYLHIAWRNIRRNKLFALISIGGLVLASTACLLVWLVCSYEFSFDDTHPNGERRCPDADPDDHLDARPGD